jgi:hypothetical protein
VRGDDLGKAIGTKDLRAVKRRVVDLSVRAGARSAARSADPSISDPRVVELLRQAGVREHVEGPGPAG